MSTNPSKTLIRAAQRASTSQFFLASALKEYQQANKLDDEALAILLECHVYDLPRLALCRRPAPEHEAFVRDIQHLAQRFHLQADHLAEIIRQADALYTLRHHVEATQASTNQGLLAAARDRDDRVSDTTEESND